MKTEIDSKIYRRALSRKLYNEDAIILYSICSVKAFQIDDKKVLVEIETHTPGYLIGRKGERISAIKEYMSCLSSNEVEIFIIESKLFQDIYN